MKAFLNVVVLLLKISIHGGKVESQCHNFYVEKYRGKSLSLQGTQCQNMSKKKKIIIIKQKKKTKREKPSVNYSDDFVFDLSQLFELYQFAIFAKMNGVFALGLFKLSFEKINYP